MARKGRTGQHLRKSGLYAGGNWPEYRYGTAKPVVHRPIYRGQRRKIVVDQVMDILRQWRLSPFENEGACRASLRSALCTKGYEWQRSDTEAESIISEGLHLLGAKRPSYAAGQWEYSVSPDYCARCHSPLDDETKTRRSRFCSAVCAKSAYEHRAYGSIRAQYEIARNAYTIIRADQAPFHPCSQCGKMFKRKNILTDLKSHQRIFCSKTCQDASLIIYADRQCPICNKTFRPRREAQACCCKSCAAKNSIKGPNRTCKRCGTAFRSYRVSDPSKGTYCSRKCCDADRDNLRFDKVCVWCKCTFVAKGARAMYCSTTCREQSKGFTSGRWVPKTLSTRVFDHFFCEAA